MINDGWSSWSIPNIGDRSWVGWNDSSRFVFPLLLISLYPLGGYHHMTRWFHNWRVTISHHISPHISCQMSTRKWCRSEHPTNMWDLPDGAQAGRHMFRHSNRLEPHWLCRPHDQRGFCTGITAVDVRYIQFCLKFWSTPTIIFNNYMYLSCDMVTVKGMNIHL